LLNDQKGKSKLKEMTKKIRDAKQFKLKTERNRMTDLGTMDQRDKEIMYRTPLSFSSSANNL